MLSASRSRLIRNYLKNDMAKERLNWTQLSSGLFVPVLLIGAAAAAYFLLLPKFKELSAVKADLAAKQNQASAQQGSFTGVKSLVADLEKKREMLASLDEALPASPDIPELLANLESLAKQSGLTVSNIDIQLPQTTTNNSFGQKVSKALGDNIGIMTVDLAVVGEYPQLNALVLNVEKNLRLLDIQGITFGDTGSDTNTQTYILQLQTYYQKS